MVRTSSSPNLLGRLTAEKVYFIKKTSILCSVAGTSVRLFLLSNVCVPSKVLPSLKAAMLETPFGVFQFQNANHLTL